MDLEFASSHRSLGSPLLRSSTGSSIDGGLWGEEPSSPLLSHSGKKISPRKTTKVKSPSSPRSPRGPKTGSGKLGVARSYPSWTPGSLFRDSRSSNRLTLLHSLLYMKRHRVIVVTYMCSLEVLGGEGVAVCVLLGPLHLDFLLGLLEGATKVGKHPADAAHAGSVLFLEVL